MKKAVQISLFIVFVIAISGLMGFVYIENSKQTIKGVIVRIDRDTDKGFLSNEKIKKEIEETDSLLFRQVKDVNTEGIEEMIAKNIYVESADVYLNLDKNIVINICEKNPVIRIYSKKGKGFFIDEKGHLLPLSPNYSPRVLIANGYIDAAFEDPNITIYDSIYKSSPLADLFELSKLIQENKFINAQISQIYVNSVGEYDLVPVVGDHLIKLGNSKNAKQKLDKLEIWYKKALIKEDWNRYSIVNLKYKDQVVCTKK